MGDDSGGRAKLARVLRLGQMGYWDWDILGGHLVWSPETYEIFGVEPGFEPTVDSVVSLIHPEDREKNARCVGELLASAPTVRFEVRVIHPTDGTLHWLDQRMEVERDRAGQALHAYGTVQDITGRKSLEAQAAQSDRLAAMGLLSAGVAHEINNPLSYVLYNLECLADDLPLFMRALGTCETRLRNHLGSEELDRITGDALESLNAAKRNDLLQRLDYVLDGMQRIRQTAHSLTTFARVETDELTAVSLPACIEVAAHMAANEIRYRARLIKELTEVPAVLGNDGRLAQVFLNLLVNAAHAIKEGDIRNNVIRVRTWSDAAWVYAEVSDTGAGIAKEVLDSVFDPYVSTGLGSARAGLGLALSKGVIEDYGGTITADSDSGKGARFTVSLPRRPRTPTRLFPPREEQVSTESRGRILVVDDEDGVRESLRHMLGDHEVVEASDGTAARTILENDQRFHLILCDLMMTDLSGMELHAWLRVASPRVADRVIFITGGAFTPRGRDYLIATGVPCLKKPFDRKELQKLVAEAVQRQPQAS